MAREGRLIQVNVGRADRVSIARTYGGKEILLRRRRGGRWCFAGG
jgi:hypothetical protein